MEQSKVESHIESTMNMASGFVISFLMWLCVVSPLVAGGYLELGHAGDSITITGIFTITSYIRSYLWRRFFAKRLHKTVIKQLKRQVIK